MAMKHQIEHGLAPSDARTVIDKAMEAYRARFADYHPEFAWKTEDKGRFSFRAKGVSVAGDIEINGSSIFVDVEVPFLLRIFRGKAIQVIDREVRRWIDRAERGEL